MQTNNNNKKKKYVHLSGLFEMVPEKNRSHPVVFNLIDGKSHVSTMSGELWFDMVKPQDAYLNGQMVFLTLTYLSGNKISEIYKEFKHVSRYYDAYKYTLKKTATGEHFLIGGGEGTDVEPFTTTEMTFEVLWGRMNLLSQAIYYIQKSQQK
jgi:hypothetical protein